MSGTNTKDSKINRILTRVSELSDRQLVIDDLLQTVFRQQKTLDVATKTAQRLEAENDRLRRYLGSVLFQRRQREMQIPTLEPRWANHEPGAKPLPPDEIPHIAIRGL